MTSHALPTSWFERELVCPRDRRDLRLAAKSLECDRGHRYPMVDGIPVMLIPEVTPTNDRMKSSWEMSPDTVSAPAPPTQGSEYIDPFVQRGIAGTNGLMYRSLVGRLRTYPIPALRLPPAGHAGRSFLDVGCNWGRWCIAAHRLGYSPVGVDSWFEPVQAARRVASQLKGPARYLVADARHLPFREHSFDVTFSYSVLQHFAKEDAQAAFGEIGRVMKPNGTAMIQMANALGVRCLYHQVKRGFRTPRAFEVRYWTPGELRQTAARLVGPASLAVDGYFTLNAQDGEVDVLPPRFRYLVRLSERLRSLSSRFVPLRYVADSLYIMARKTA
jgi:SAM-dependent methyltransferase/uncharacterized protein YbaR (Trm112 family)